MGLLDAAATMTAYDSIERGVVDECEPLRGRRPRAFTLTQLLVACVAVCVCAVAATLAVNTHREGMMAPSLGRHLWKWSSACKSKQIALKKTLMSCNSDLKSKINERSAELGEPVRNGCVLLGSKNSCASVMKEEQDLLAECKAELAVHNENAELKAQNEKPKAENEKLKAQIEKLKAENEKPKAENEKPKAENEKLKAENEKLKAENEKPKAENEKLKAQIEKLKAENEKLKAQIEKLKA